MALGLTCALQSDAVWPEIFCLQGVYASNEVLKGATKLFEGELHGAGTKQD